MSAVRPNQNRDNWLSTQPLSGTAEPRTTSYAEILSVATIRRCSPTSYMSRTLPRRWTAMPSRDVSKSEALADNRGPRCGMEAYSLTGPPRDGKTKL